MQKLFKAIEKGDVDALQTQLATSPNLLAKNKKQYTPLIVAVQSGDLSVLEAMRDSKLQLGVNERDGDQGWTPLIHAIASVGGDLELIRFLVEELKADIKCVDRDEGLSPLHWASRLNQTNVIEYLLSRGGKAYIDTQSSDDPLSLTPLHCAIRKNQEEACVLLIERGANVNTKDSDGNTSLHAALKQHLLNVAALVAEQPASQQTATTQDGQNLDGETALHIAVSLGLDTVASLLVKRGWSETAKNAKGETPNDLREKRHAKQAAEIEAKQQAREAKEVRKRRGVEEEMDHSEVTAWLRKYNLPDLVPVFFSKGYRYTDEAFYEIDDHRLKKMGLSIQQSRAFFDAIAEEEAERIREQERAEEEIKQEAQKANRMQTYIVVAVIVALFVLIYIALMFFVKYKSRGTSRIL
ncbi:unnamed protein product [Vitrella brassicaformis CCMP3155]|uniref:Uncharacterized protein n=2 Tax=Vitrella brassicaformis TaxID=1169539 RepID=A0A0G4EBF8_VITBC|nr:unnamed protein product [Vitrella brassicaformis CCMP3155]|eukprot:CEL92602.1 unnamed protein product [Vitrella brassicaformis CCMP3155]